MTPAEGEHYTFLRLYSIDLDQALQSLAAADKYRDVGEVWPALLRDATVCYARPFSGNFGSEGTHRLPDSFVPAEHRALHDELVKLRRHLFAHTDGTFHKPRVMVNIGTPEQPCYPMSFKGGNAHSLLARLPEVRALMKAVEAKLLAEIKSTERRADFGRE